MSRRVYSRKEENKLSLNDFPAKETDEFSLRERSDFLLEERVSKEKGVDWMIVEKDWDYFLEYIFW